MSELKVNSIVDASSGNTVQINGQTPSESNMQGRNRIINGDMRIDQRNAGAAVTLTSSNAYYLDRWITRTGTGSSNTVQQSSTAPVGLTNSLLVTIGTGASPAASAQNYVLQAVEGFNFSDLNFGSANAQTATISFWVRSSVTGTFSGALENFENNRSYPFTYTISAANTFEYKTVTIAGDTTGTWLTNNSVGCRLIFDLGTGSDRQGSAGAWAAGFFRAATGSTKLVETSGATFFITGVQLEAGVVATPFERRPFGAELQLCQRYFEQWRSPVAGSQNIFILYGTGGNNAVSTTLSWAVTKRADPTVVLSNNTNTNITNLALAASTNNLTFQPSVTNAGVAQMNIAANLVWITASSEL